MKTYKDIVENITELVKKHDKNMEASISLVASGNVVSQRVLDIMASDLTYRAAEGKRGKAHFPGLEHFYEIEETAEKEISKLFNAEFADLRPISGSQANHIAYTALTNVGDTIIVPTVRSGSHISMSGNIIKKLRNYNLIPAKTQAKSLLLDEESLIRDIKEHQPALIVLGGSLINEWQDLTNIVNAAHQQGAKVLYDASHVAGLIATKTFPNPLDYGVDIMTMTTCKTIPGPSHAWIVGKKEYEEAINKAVFPGFVSGGHLQEYVGAVVSMLEVAAYGKEYGEQVIKTANQLGELLEQGGFDILRTKDGSVTHTHQVIAQAHKNQPIKSIEERLASIGIYCNQNYLPKNGFENDIGVRFGTQEAVRVGMTERHVKEIGTIINDYLQDENPDKQAYRERVTKIKRSFNGVSYC